MPALNILLGAIIGLIIGAAAVYFMIRPQIEQKVAAAEHEIEEQRTLSEKENTEILETSRRESQQIRQEAEKAIERRYQDLARTEKRVDRRNDNLDNQVKKIEHREAVINKRQSRLDKRQNQLETIEQERREELERLAALTSDEAKQLLLNDVEKESRQDMARIMREIEDEAKETANHKARELVVMAIQRIATDQVAEQTVSTVPLPSEEMKGRIIGRNGRNIRAFEQAAGVDIVVDDTPEAVSVSSFDPVRRE
ncbi:Ribonuclease Y, partial [hydrothermal vent metagenome]